MYQHDYFLFFLTENIFAENKSSENGTAPKRIMARQTVKTKKDWITAGHKKFDILKQKFISRAEVTKACLSCHSEAATQFHKTIH